MKLNNFNIKTNFWETNPHFLIIEDFKIFYDEDKSKDKKESSGVMWAIALLVHPDSPIFDLDYNYRRTCIASEYIRKDISFWNENEAALVAFQKHVLTSGQRQLVEWSRIMDEKSTLLRRMEYNEDTWETIEKMLKSNKSLFDEYERINESLSKEGHGGDVKGGAEESASEKGII